MNLRREFKIVFSFLLLGAFFVFSGYANAQSGSLYLSPSSGSVIAGQNFSIVLRVNTGGVAINAAEGSLVYDTAKVQITSISKAGSIFTIWASEPRFSNAEGIVEFAGGIPNPGYSGSSGTVLTINFKAKTATTVRGYTEIVMVSGAILANDGEGTNILSSLGKANYYIGASSIKPSSLPEPSDNDLTTSVANIKSTTHPDSSKWYSSNDPVFTWELSDATEVVSYLITDRPTSNPGTIPDGLVSDAQFNDVSDGVNYFHLRFRENGAWGSIEHFKFQVDTKPPKEFKVLVEDDNSSEPKLTFESEDDLSGLERYEIKIDKNEWITVDKTLGGKPYTLSGLSYGEHLILVNAVDKAGNTTTVSTGITVPGGIWNKFMDMIRWIFRNWLFPAIIVALVALAHEFFGHSKWWKKFRKNLNLKKIKKDNIVDLRDVRELKK